MPPATRRSIAGLRESEFLLPRSRQPRLPARRLLAATGYDICAFIGINLHQAGDHIRVVEQLKKMPEVVEAHFTTGSYSLFIKAFVSSTAGLHRFLVEKLQPIPEVQSTETLISLDMPIDRALSIQVASNIRK